MDDDDVQPTPAGLLRCLGALSDEAATLRLSRTFAALQDTIAICKAEAEVKQLSRGRRSPAVPIH